MKNQKEQMHASPKKGEKEGQILSKTFEPNVLGSWTAWYPSPQYPLPQRAASVEQRAADHHQCARI